jgi:hypothetical protein
VCVWQVEMMRASGLASRSRLLAANSTRSRRCGIDNSASGQQNRAPSRHIRQTSLQHAGNPTSTAQQCFARGASKQPISFMYEVGTRTSRAVQRVFVCRHCVTQHEHPEMQGKARTTARACVQLITSQGRNGSRICAVCSALFRRRARY